MKTEHEKLKEICDEIKYSSFDKIYLLWLNMYVKNIRQDMDWGTIYDEVDVREIIFIPEFRDALFDYLEKNYTEKKSQDVMEEMWFELHDPVTYLYNLLELWNH